MLKTILVKDLAVISTHIIINNKKMNTIYYNLSTVCKILTIRFAKPTIKQILKF